MTDRLAAPSRFTVVKLRGEIDISAAPAVTARLDDLTSTGQPHVIVDLRLVTFIDCSGLGTLCRARRRALSRNGRLGLVVVDPRVLRILRILRLSHAFELYETLPAVVPLSFPVTTGKWKSAG
jgi:anti-anti-sigma factor